MKPGEGASGAAAEDGAGTAPEYGPGRVARGQGQAWGGRRSKVEA